MARRVASLCVQSTEEPAAREVKNKCIEPSALARYDRIQLALINKQVQIIGREDATSQSPLAVSKFCLVLGVILFDKSLGHVLRITAASAFFVQIDIFHTGSIGLLFLDGR